MRLDTRRREGKEKERTISASGLAPAAAIFAREMRLTNEGGQGGRVCVGGRGRPAQAEGRADRANGSSARGFPH